MDFGVFLHFFAEKAIKTIISEYIGCINLEGLNLRSKRHRRSRAGAHRLNGPQIANINQCWSMDFVSDQLFDGKRFRALALVDNYQQKMSCYRSRSISQRNWMLLIL